MNLQQAQDILKIKNSEYHNAHAKILKILNIDLSKSLAHYLEQIKNDPILWLDAFPTDSASSSSLSKIKSAVFYLLRYVDDIKNEFGYDYCQELIKIIEKAWKSNIQHMIDIRKAIKAEKDKNLSGKLISKDQTTDTVHHDDFQVEIEELHTLLAEANSKLHDQSIQIEKLNAELQASQHSIQLVKDANVQLVQDNQKMQDKFNLLKNLFIDFAKQKDATKSELLLLDRLLPEW